MTTSTGTAGAGSAGLGGGLAPLLLDAPAIEQLQKVLRDVESGRGVLVRMADLMGGAVGQAARLGLRGLGLAPNLETKLRGVAEAALTRAFDVAVLGLRGPADEAMTDVPAGVNWRGHAAQAAVVVSGAVGGFGGLAGLVPDVSFTTLAIMREIARIAREEGEDLSDEDARRACLEVFALRSFVGTRDAEESEIGFFSARAVLRGRPVVMLISEVAAHYGLGLSRKFALQMMPVAGALCGASLNAAFLSHYRALARAHFTIRRLERAHGPAVRETAESLRSGNAAF